nr:BglG family transcription antiterminator [Caldanaerovirga acetigignens]
MLKKLINSKRPLKIAELAGMFQVSKRTVRYDLDAIDNFLKDNNLPQLLRKPNVGVKFSPALEDEKRLFSLLNQSNFADYVLSQKERINFIISELIQQKDYININQLADMLKVSRSTVLKDLKKVRNWLSSHGLELVALPRRGLKIIGEEKQLRRAAIELLTETVDIYRFLEVFKESLYFSREELFDGYGAKLFKDIDIKYIEECLKVAERELNIVFSDAAFSGFVVHIAMAIKRIKLGKDIVMPQEELESLKITKEFAVASNIAKMLEEYYNVSIPIEEIGYIAVHLLGSTTTKTKNIQDENWMEYQILVHQIISLVSSNLSIDLSKDKQLFDGLLEHLRPTVYRLRHDLGIKNPILDEIKLNYKELFEIVKISLKPLEVYTQKSVPDEEVGYFVLHFGAALERLKSKDIAKPKILVVCGTGIGTAKLLSSRLQSIFDIDIVDAVSYRQAKEVIKEKKVDLIVSSIPVREEDVNVRAVVVNPLLKERDIRRLENYITRVKRKYDEANKVEEIIKAVEKYADIREREKLKEELMKFFEIPSIHNCERGDVQPVLKDVLVEDTIVLNVEAKDWEEAIRIGGELLVEKGFATQNYIEAMINNVKKTGPYIVIAPGIAMPHARPEEGAKEIGMSLITLKNPVNFGNKENDPVKIVVCLCAVDHSSHLKALSELVQLLGDKEKVKKILEAKEAKEIISLMS